MSKKKKRTKEDKKKTTKEWYENGGREWYKKYHKEYFSDPEKRRKRNERRKKYRNDPEYRKRENELARKRYSKEKQHLAYKKSLLKPEVVKNRRKCYERWTSENKEYRKQYSKEYGSKPENRKKTRARELKRKYNITIDVESEMYCTQSGKCAVCNYKFKEYDDGSNSNDFVIDHCHSSGLVRGLLCNKCNQGIGLFMENKKTIENTIKYLELHAK